MGKNIKQVLQKNLKRLIACTIAAAISLSLPTGIIDGTGKVSAKDGVYSTLPTDGKWVNGHVPESTNDYYKVVLNSAGFLTVTYQSLTVRQSSYYITSYDNKKMYSDIGVTGASKNNPKTHTTTLALEKGTYWVKVAGWYDYNPGDYRLKANFVPAENNEAESNNKFEAAMNLQEKALVTGFFSVDDALDFYKFNASKDMTIRVTFTTKIANSEFSVWDSTPSCVREVSMLSASEAAPRTTTADVAVKAGVNYIKIMPCCWTDQEGKGHHHTGRYQVKWEEVPSSNETSAKTVDSAAPSSANVKKIGKLKANSLGNKKVAISWKKQTEASGYEIQISTNKKFSKNLVTKTVKAGKHNYKLKFNKTGKAYIRVRALDSNGLSGDWSKVKKVIVR